MLGSLSGILEIGIRQQVKVEYASSGVTFSKQTAATYINTKLTLTIKDGNITQSSFSGGTGNSTHISNTSGVNFRAAVSNFEITSIEFTPT